MPEPTPSQDPVANIINRLSIVKSQRDDAWALLKEAANALESDIEAERADMHKKISDHLDQT